MRCVHFCPVSAAGKIRSTGIPIATRRKTRACGVYAVPMLEHATRNKTALHSWRHLLRRERNIRLATVVFEIPDDEEVFFFRDYSDNVWWISRELVTAKVAAQQAAALAEELAATNDLWDGDPVWYPQYTLLQAELVVPRAILPKEIRAVRYWSGRRRVSRRQWARNMRKEETMEREVEVRFSGADFFLSMCCRRSMAASERESASRASRRDQGNRSLTRRLRSDSDSRESRSRKLFRISSRIAPGEWKGCDADTS